MCVRDSRRWKEPGVRNVRTLNNSRGTNTDFIFNPYKSDSRAELLVNTGGAAVVDLLRMDPESDE